MRPRPMSNWPTISQSGTDSSGILSLNIQIAAHMNDRTYREQLDVLFFFLKRSLPDSAETLRRPTFTLQASLMRPSNVSLWSLNRETRDGVQVCCTVKWSRFVVTALRGANRRSTADVRHLPRKERRKMYHLDHQISVMTILARHGDRHMLIINGGNT